MLYINYKITLKNIFRSPTFILSVFGSFVMIMMTNLGIIGGKELNWIEFSSQIQYHISSGTMSFLPYFISTIIAFDILNDRDNNFLDILFSRKIKYHEYFFSKLMAYITVGLLFLLIYTFIFHIVEISVNTLLFEYNIWKITTSYLYRMLFIYSGGLMVFISLTIFFAALFGKGGYGMITVAIYYSFEFIFYDIWTNFTNPFYLYFLHVPLKIDLYLKEWGTENFVEYYVSGAFGEISLSQALLALFCEIAFSLILLIASYFILKKKLGIIRK